MDNPQCYFLTSKLINSLLPNLLKKADYGRHSETAEVLVSDEGLAIQSLLKVQSGHLGNLVESPFDGDEMNMHMPQNVLAETELRHLAAIPYQMISPTSNSPIIGIYQDSLLGSYRFTRPDIQFTQREAMNLLMMFSNVNTDALREKGDKVSSFDILSQIMPPITLKYKTKLYDEAEDYETSNNVLKINNGQYTCGQIEKSVLGASTKGIIHRVFNDFGPMAASNFVDDLQNIVTEYMKTSSFSVGISDLMSNKETQDSIIQIITEKKQAAQSFIDKVHLGIFENNTARSNIDEFEFSVNNILNEATNQAGQKGLKSLNQDNRFVMIVKSGSKGTELNISQMISCLGQQNVDGKRIPYGFDSRTLPHFNKFDDSPNARGFVENSYISGLTAPELFFHAMGGRIGLIDTAVKTSQTGYIQRRLIKGLEDLKVEYDMTVRNNKGKIAQFAYGDDGFDSAKVENQAIPLVGMSTEDIYLHYDIIGVNDQHNDLLSIYAKGTVTRVKKQRAESKSICKRYIDKMIIARDNIVDAVFNNKDENQLKLPVAFQHIIANIQGQLGFNVNSAVDITPMETFALIEEYFDKLKMLTFVQPNQLFEALYYFYLTPKDLLINKRFHRKGIIMLLETVILKYKQSIVHPGEMVGVIAGQSIGEPTTQLTLNSVTYETLILVRTHKGEMKKVSIGDFTKEHIEKSKNIEYMQDKDTTYAELSQHYEVPCANEQGETVWCKIEAVTQHPVINKDGTNTMLKVITKGNREVIATKAKSFLKLVDGKIQSVEGDTLKVGDYLPASRKQLSYTETLFLELQTILPKTKYIYGSEMEKVRKVMHEHFWWKNHANSTFIVPYSRSDSAYAALNKTGKNKNSVDYLPGMVYMKKNSTALPDVIEMDYDFGYLVGAYCAEGCMTKFQVSIANNDEDFMKPIQRWCDRYGLTTKYYVHKNKIQKGWTSSDIRIYSTLLCDVLSRLCGKLSHNKFVSDKIIFSNETCIRGFLDAYISGDGTIYGERNKSIIISSVSKEMLTDVQVMMKNIGVIGKMYKNTTVTSNNRGTKPENIHQGYRITIANKQCQKLANLINLTIKSKQERVIQLRESKFKYDYSMYDELPNSIDGKLVMQHRDGNMMDLEFDKIISIEEIQNTTDYAYDLTVEETRNFDCYNGLCLRDTFHNSGTSSKSNVTRGVPRIEEILRLTKNPKSPSLTVYLKELEQHDKDRATKYANMLEHTKLVDVIKSVQICFDPNDKNTAIQSDRILMEQFYEFENIMKDCLDSVNDEAETQKSNWIVRMEMDAETLLDKNITMDDIHFAIVNSYGNEISCVYSDYNMSNLVFRIRLNSTALNKTKKVKGIPETLDQSDDIYLLRNFQDTVLNNIVLRGVQGIHKVSERKIRDTVVKEDGKYVKKDVWILDTTGTNLLEVLAMDFIDGNRTFCNDITEIFNVLGIEAARQTIHNEFVDVMGASGVSINYHHLSLLCDRMTMTKNLVSIFRSGILNDDIGPISKSTFEVHTEVLLSAARHAEFDHMRGVSASVMMGQHGYFGTGSFSLVLDMKEIENMDAQEIVVTNTNKEIEKMFGQMEDKTDICSKSNIRIENNLSSIKKEEMSVCTDDGYDAGF